MSTIFDAIDIKLTAEEVLALEKPYRPHSIGHEPPHGSKRIQLGAGEVVTVTASIAPWARKRSSDQSFEARRNGRIGTGTAPKAGFASTYNRR